MKRANYLNLANKSIAYLLFIKKLHLVALLSIGVALSVYSQEAKKDLKVVDKTEYLRTNFQDQKNFIQLSEGINSAIYLQNDNYSIYGDAPKCLFTDLQSIKLLENNSLPISSIEMITIKINGVDDLKSILDLDVFLRFHNLKYILFSSKVEFTKDNLVKIIKNNKQEYILLYTVEKEG